MSITYVTDYDSPWDEDWYTTEAQRAVEQFPQTPADEDQLDDVKQMIAEGDVTGGWYGVHYPLAAPPKDSSELAFVVSMMFGFLVTLGIGKLTHFPEAFYVLAGALVAGCISSVVMMAVITFITNRLAAKPAAPQVVGDLKTLQDRLHRHGEIQTADRFAAQATVDDDGLARLQIIQFSPSDNHSRLWARVILDEAAPTELTAATERAVEVATQAAQLEEQVRHNLCSIEENSRIEHELAREEEINQNSLLEAMDRAITLGG